MTVREAPERESSSSKLGMWLFLFTEILLFGGMFLLYAVFRVTHSADFHRAALELNRIAGTVNTVILLSSSLTMALSIAAIKNGRRKLSLSLQGTTIFLGAVFLIVKSIEWNSKIGLGIYPGSPVLLAMAKGEILFYGLYFMMTGLHGLHVLAGTGLLLFTLASTARNAIRADSHAWLENSGLYWHLVDAVWIYLFPLFYLVS